eukprot:6187381-Pleurochrysis_carterae.AAC.3
MMGSQSLRSCAVAVIGPYRRDTDDGRATLLAISPLASDLNQVLLSKLIGAQEYKPKYPARYRIRKGARQSCLEGHVRRYF